MVTKKRRRFEIRQKQKRRAKREPVFHFITFRKGETFPALKRIIKEGFKGTVESNVIVRPDKKAFYRAFSGPRQQYLESKGKHTFGDRYAIEMLTKIKRDEALKGQPLKQGEHADVRYAFPKQIKKIFIRINPSLSGVEREKRIEFYKKEFPKTPIEFV